ncbi:MAG TPA: glycosyltransferase 87 family protein [Candidatus Dormibacteraeota bacterium]|nr:glycosyltransferase 87 family protein [Candidatus Dormibacteraeota bacterium]
MSRALAALPPWRHQAGAAGLGLYALALWQRIGYFTFGSLVTLVLALALLGIAGLMPERDPGRSLWSYPVLFLLLLPLAAASTPGLVPGISLGYALAMPVFLVTGMIPGAARWRLPLTGLCLIGAHVAMLLAAPYPAGQDVFIFLNRGVDTLLRLHNPYAPNPAVDGGYILTYPPAIILLGTPFRVLFGDIRWGYLFAEAASVALLAGLARRLGRRREAWLDALILLPMAMPRLAIAYFDFSNHELALVPIALLGLRLALAGHPRLAGAALGVGVAAKQYFVVFPGLFLAAFLEPATLVAGLAAAAAIVVPFLLWNPAAMLGNLFSQLSAPPDPSRLTLYSAASRLGVGGRNLLRVLSLGGTAAFAILAWLSRRDLGASLRACGIALAVFTLAAPFAAYNYYGYAFWFLCAGFLVPGGWSRARVLAAAGPVPAMG